MKRKTLTTAVLAGLTGVAGMMSVANAVNVNPDGLGQVLLYPYYSARGGNQTLISVVNTTSNAKAVKIRFLDALNSLETLDFNIYMSAFDVWVGAVADLPLDAPDGKADLIVPDTTCTSPFLFDADQQPDEGQQEFVNFLVDGDDDRTMSGHVEIIEMGTLVNEGGFTPATWATHIDNPAYDPADPDSAPRRIPSDCQSINRAWSTVQGVDGTWIIDENVGIDPASGGLFGGASVVNVEEGTLFSYNATAIDGFYTSTGFFHTTPGNPAPDLTGNPISGVTRTTSNVFSNASVLSDQWTSNGALGTILAVNASITRETVLNEYVFNAAENSTKPRTEWLVTFPTKRPHVNADPDPIPPFTSLFALPDGACEQVFFERNLFDREEDTTTPGSDGPVVSPEPPPDEEQDFELCFESQVIRFGTEDSLEGASEIFKEPAGRIVNIDPTAEGFNSGWVRFSFNPINPDGSIVAGEEVHSSVPADGTGNVYQGLPFIGFSVSRFSNGTIVNDEGVEVLSNYAGSIEHRGTRRITQ